MKNLTKAAAAVGLMGLLACGCATKKIETTEVPRSPEEAKVVVVPTPMPSTPVAEQRYTVRKGDTLWAISRQAGIYSNSFEWPLLFRRNRDGIKDPDEIEVGEVLIIQEGQTPDEVKHAIHLASETPPFARHTNPRQPLPIDYF